MNEGKAQYLCVCVCGGGGGGGGSWLFFNPVGGCLL